MLEKEPSHKYRFVFLFLVIGFIILLTLFLPLWFHRDVQVDQIHITNPNSNSFTIVWRTDRKVESTLRVSTLDDGYKFWMAEGGVYGNGIIPHVSKLISFWQGKGKYLHHVDVVNLPADAVYKLEIVPSVSSSREYLMVSTLPDSVSTSNNPDPIYGHLVSDYEEVIVVAYLRNHPDISLSGVVDRDREVYNLDANLIHDVIDARGDLDSTELVIKVISESSTSLVMDNNINNAKPLNTIFYGSQTTSPVLSGLFGSRSLMTAIEASSATAFAQCSVTSSVSYSVGDDCEKSARRACLQNGELLVNANCPVRTVEEEPQTNPITAAVNNLLQAGSSSSSPQPSSPPPPPATPVAQPAREVAQPVDDFLPNPATSPRPTVARPNNLDSDRRDQVAQQSSPWQGNQPRRRGLENIVNRSTPEPVDTADESETPPIVSPIVSNFYLSNCPAVNRSGSSRSGSDNPVINFALCGNGQSIVINNPGNFCAEAGQFCVDKGGVLSTDAGGDLCTNRCLPSADILPDLELAERTIGLFDSDDGTFSLDACGYLLEGEAPSWTEDSPGSATFSSSCRCASSAQGTLTSNPFLVSGGDRNLIEDFNELCSQELEDEDQGSSVSRSQRPIDPETIQFNIGINYSERNSANDMPISDSITLTPFELSQITAEADNYCRQILDETLAGRTVERGTFAGRTDGGEICVVVGGDTRLTDRQYSADYLRSGCRDSVATLVAQQCSDVAVGGSCGFSLEGEGRTSGQIARDSIAEAVVTYVEFAMMFRGGGGRGVVTDTGNALEHTLMSIQEAESTNLEINDLVRIDQDPISYCCQGNSNPQVIINRYDGDTFSSESVPCTVGAFSGIAPTRVEAQESGSNTANNFQVTESGEYYFSVAGNDISRREVVIGEGGSVELRPFIDLNGNGIRDPLEPYLELGPEYSYQLSKRRETIPYNLDFGWNLIHIPLIIEEGDEPLVLASETFNYMNSKGVKLRHIASFRNGRFHTYTVREGDSVFSPDFEILPGEPIFVFSEYRATGLPISGRRYTSLADRSIQMGWNTIGFTNIAQTSTSSSEQVFNYFGDQGVTIDTISQFQSGSYQSVIQDNGVIFGNNFPLSETRGYFVRAKTVGSSSVVGL